MFQSIFQIMFSRNLYTPPFRKPGGRAPPGNARSLARPAVAVAVGVEVERALELALLMPDE
jgi:hypothetical protein